MHIDDLDDESGDTPKNQNIDQAVNDDGGSPRGQKNTGGTSKKRLQAQNEVLSEADEIKLMIKNLQCRKRE